VVDTGIKQMRFSIISALLLAATTMSAHAATITVINTNDSGPGSLRQALANASNGDTINFAVTGTISLISGELVIGKNVTIAGPGANRLSIDGGQELGSTYTFAVVSGETVTISGLTITGDGGGIRNDDAILTVSNCVVSGAAQQAGLLNSGVIASVTIINSLFSDNSEGIYNNSGGTGAGNCTAGTTIANSVVTGNTFGIYTSNLASTVTVLNSRLTDNFLDAINTSGNAEITVKNSTISGNFDGILTNTTLDLVLRPFPCGRAHSRAAPARSDVRSAPERSALPKTLRGKAAVKQCWEIIADKLSKAGWSWGCVSAVTSEGRIIWVAEAHRDDGKRFVLHAGEKLTAFIELERITRESFRVCSVEQGSS
jgi:hypothetical protein